MKSFFLSLIAYFVIYAAQATILTVDNNSVSAGQYTDLQTAIDAASTGDTLHIIGSLSSYGNVTLNKRLTLIGAGYNSPNQFNLSTKINALSLGQNLPNNPSGSKIMGCEISNMSWSFNTSYNNITIERCQMGSVSIPSNQCTGWLLQHNIINFLAVGFNSNIVIQNNIITSSISSSNEPTVLISNNLFTRSNNSPYFSNVSAANIANNIFYQGAGPQGCTLSTFNNNITFGTTNDMIPYGNNIGANNLVGVDPQFNNVGTPGFDLDDDYRYPLSSPATDAGTDGTDIGIYGSIVPFPIGGPSPYLMSAPPRIPQMVELNVLNSTIFQGDSITVQVRARKQD